MLDQVKHGINQVKFVRSNAREIVHFVKDISGIDLGTRTAIMTGLVFPEALMDAITVSNTSDFDWSLQAERSPSNQFEEFWQNMKFGMTVILVTDEIVELAIKERIAQKSGETLSPLTQSIIERIRNIQVVDNVAVEISNQLIDETIKKFTSSGIILKEPVVSTIREMMPDVIIAMLDEKRSYCDDSYKDFLAVSTMTNAIHVFGAVVACLLGEDPTDFSEQLQSLNEKFRIMTDIMTVYKDQLSGEPNVVLKYIEDQQVDLKSAVAMLKAQVVANRLGAIPYADSIVTIVFLSSALQRMINIVDSPVGRLYNWWTKRKLSREKGET